MSPGITRGLILILAIVIGAGCVVRSGMLFRKHLFGGATSGGASQLRTSIISGCLVGLAFICVTVVMGVLDVEYTWSLHSVLGMLLLAIAGGVVVTIGTYWRLFVVGKYRDHLLHELGKKGQRRQAASGGESDDA